MFIDEVYIRGCSSLSVPQLTWSAKALVQSYKALEFGSEHTVAYLPLSHIAAQVSPCTIHYWETLLFNSLGLKAFWNY